MCGSDIQSTREIFSEEEIVFFCWIMYSAVFFVFGYVPQFAAVNFASRLAHLGEQGAYGDGRNSLRSDISDVKAITASDVRKVMETPHVSVSASNDWKHNCSKLAVSKRSCSRSPIDKVLIELGECSALLAQCPDFILTIRSPCS